MVTTEIGKKYRDTIKGAVGTAAAKMDTAEKTRSGEDCLVPMTQLKLDAEFLHDENFNDLGHHDNRWFADSRLVDA